LIVKDPSAEGIEAGGMRPHFASMRPGPSGDRGDHDVGRICAARSRARLQSSEERMSVYLVQKLRARHRALEREIEDELNTPLPDPLRVAEAKREKLHVKDRIVKVLREEEFARTY
jgi:hypothetical protein